MTDAELLAMAEEVSARAHAPYSKFRVGAAIEDERGQIHCGCNVENIAYPLGSCAEAGAISAMIASGGHRIRRVAIAGGTGVPGRCMPCGGCRQRIAEFAMHDTAIIVRQHSESATAFSFASLLPEAFTPDFDSGQMPVVDRDDGASL